MLVADTHVACRADGAVGCSADAFADGCEDDIALCDALEGPVDPALEPGGALGEGAPVGRGLAEPAPDLWICAGLGKIWGVAAIDRLESDASAVEHDRGPGVLQIGLHIRFGS